jgi:dihydropteroate synthase
MEAAGAHLIDIGGESTRPGSAGISAAEEMRRILPVLEKLRGRIQIPISVDTSKAEVAEGAAEAGAEILNDVTGLRNNPRIADVARRRKLGLVLMHMRGTPRTMQQGPFARDVIREVTAGLRRSIAVALEAGVAKSRIVVDPGIGFGKSHAQNFEIIGRLPDLAKLGFPVLVGTSRKGFLGAATEKYKDSDRIWGTAATVTASIVLGAHIVRVHDVAEMVQVARVADAVRTPRRPRSDE